MQGFLRSVTRFAPRTGLTPFVHKNTSFHYNHASHRIYPVRMFLYRTFIRPSSAYTLLIALMCVGGEILVNYYGDMFWRFANKGKSFEEMISTFPEVPPGCEE